MSPHPPNITGHRFLLLSDICGRLPVAISPGLEALEDILHGRWEDVGCCRCHPWHHMNPAIGAGNTRLWHRSLAVESWAMKPPPLDPLVYQHGSRDKLTILWCHHFPNHLGRWYWCTSMKGRMNHLKHHVNAGTWKDSQWLKPAQPPNHESSYPKARPSWSGWSMKKHVQWMKSKPRNYKLWNTRLVNSYMELIFRQKRLFSFLSASAATERTTGATSVISTVSEFQVINVSPGCISLARSQGIWEEPVWIHDAPLTINHWSVVTETDGWMDVYK